MNTDTAMDGPIEPKTISVVEAGKYFGLRRAGSYAAAARGELPTIRIGRRLRVPVVALERMLQEARPLQERKVVTLEELGLG
jgi:Helix-turn-helix domain